MNPFLKSLLILVVLFFMASCNGGGSSDNTPDDFTISKTLSCTPLKEEIHVVKGNKNVFISGWFAFALRMLFRVIS